MAITGRQCFDGFADMHQVFEGLNVKTQLKLQSIASVKEIDAGTFIGHHSLYADGIYLILAGAARASTLDEHGNQLYVTTSSIGEIYGLFSVMGKKPDIHMVMAITPMTAIFLPAESFKNIAYADRQLCEQVIRFICGWLTYLSDIANRFALMNPVNRITHCLADIAPAYLINTDEMPVELKLRISQYELSGMLALSRQCVNQHLKALEALGVLRIGYKSITIKDLAKLREINSLSR